MKLWYLPLILGAALTTLTVQAEPVDVYLVTGQSNVKQEWADGIEPQLNALSSEIKSVTVVDRYPGNQLNRWWNNGPQGNYNGNIAILEETFRDLQSDGYEPVLKGIFWFQGESDWGKASEISAYKSRFKSYIEQLSNDMNVNSIHLAIAVLDANQDAEFDDPKVLGATRDDVEEMRNILFELGDELGGLAFDSRGYSRRDSVHLNLAALRNLGEDMAVEFYNTIFKGESSSHTPTPTITPTPSDDLSIPGRIEAENFTSQNGTRVERTGDNGGGDNVGHIEPGDFLSYTGNVSTAGTYELQLRVASPRSNTDIDVSVNGRSAGKVDVPNTGDWQDYVTVALNIDLSLGNQTIRLDFSGSNSGLVNVNWLNTSLINEQTGSPESTVVMQKNNTSYSIDGDKDSRNEGDSAYLYRTNQGNVNQQWVEANHSGDYYSYKKVNTNLCLDGGNGAGNGQAVTTEQCDNDNQDQHWSKNFLPNGTVRLEKRGTSHSIDGNVAAENFQNLHLWRSNDSNINQQWEFLAPR